MLAKADGALQAASLVLGRKLPASGSYVRSLLQRNWYIIRGADAVFAVSTLEEKGRGLKLAGGTAWGCEMFFAKASSDIPLFLFDLHRRKWYKAMLDATWLACEAPSPAQYDRLALIGSREITQVGKDAIRDIFSYLK
jgi:hypothetical protein